MRALEGPAADVAGLLDLHLVGRLSLPELEQRVAAVVGASRAPSAAALRAAAARLAGAGQPPPPECEWDHAGELCVRCRAQLYRWHDLRDPLVVGLLHPIR